MSQHALRATLMLASMLGAPGCVRGGFGTNSAGIPSDLEVAEALVDAGPGVDFALAASTNFPLVGCRLANGKRDLIRLPFMPAGPPVVQNRVGTNGTLCFASQPGVATTLEADMAVLSAYFDKSGYVGTTCTITATLAVNGDRILGSGELTLPITAPLRLRKIQFTTAGASFNATDQLTLTITWYATKACNEASLHYADPTVFSLLHVPLMH